MMNATNTAVIMAAGEGRRMRPLTAGRPKVMLPLAGRPILEHLVKACAVSGLNELIIVVGYHEEEVRRYLGDGTGLGVSLKYVVQRAPRGTGDALALAQPFVNAPSFLLMNGDITVNAADIRLLAGMEAPAMGIIERPSVAGFGVVEIAGDRVTALHEKTESPPTRLVNAGLYHFDRRIFDFAGGLAESPRGEYEITGAIQGMIDSGIGVGFRHLDSWRDIGDAQALLGANAEMLGKMTDGDTAGAEVEPGVVIKGPISIGPGSLLRSGVYIQGPVIIGGDCEIGPNCYLRPGTVIGDRCRIGAGVEVKNSIIMDGSRVPHLSYIGDSVIGRDCNIGAGTQVANLRLDRRPVSEQCRKLGVIMGDGVVTGINACINPGTVVGAGAVIGPGAVVSGAIGPGARVY